MNPQPSAAEIQERAREILRQTGRTPPSAPATGPPEAPRFTDPIPARTLNEFVEVIHSRSVQLGSARLGVTAKLDLVEARTDPEDLFSTLEVCPVDYKAGAPRPGEDGNELWDADKMQLGL